MKNLKMNVIVFNVDSVIYDNPEYVEKAQSFAIKSVEEIFPDIKTDSFGISEDMKKYEVIRNEFILVDPIRTDLYNGCINDSTEYKLSVNRTMENFKEMIGVHKGKLFGEAMARIDCVIESIRMSKKLQDFVHDSRVGNSGYYRANLIVLCDNETIGSFLKLYDIKEARVMIDHLIKYDIMTFCNRLYNYSPNMPHIDVSVFMAKEIDLVDIEITGKNVFTMSTSSIYQN